MTDAEHREHDVTHRSDDYALIVDTEAEQNYIRELERRVTELEAENNYLRHAAGAFGELAERLNAVVQQRQSAELRVRALRLCAPDAASPRNA